MSFGHAVLPPCNAMAVAAVSMPSVWLASEGPGYEPASPPLGDGTKTQEALAGRRILIVEDEMMLAMYLQMELEEIGAQTVGPAARVDAAVALVSDPDIAIDAAILDVDLHGRDVFPVAQVLRERGVPFVFYTGHGTRADLNARFEGAPVCIKPTLTEDLLAVVAGLLR